eukprot:s2055_g18.t1
MHQKNQKQLSQGVKEIAAINPIRCAHRALADTLKPKQGDPDEAPDSSTVYDQLIEAINCIHCNCNHSRLGCHAEGQVGQRRRRCHQVPRLPHKVKADVTKCHACHTKRRQTSPSATPANAKETRRHGTKRDQGRHQSQCCKCHACHTKGRQMSPSATPATRNEGRCRQDWDFTQVFTLLLLLLIAAALATLVLVSLCAILVYFFTPGKNRKTKTSIITNLAKATPVGTAIRALQQVAGDIVSSDEHEMEANLAAMNTYDYKAVISAIQLISHSVVPAGHLPEGMGMRTSLRIIPSNASLKPKARTQSSRPAQDAQSEQPEPETVEPEEAAEPEAVKPEEAAVAIPAGNEVESRAEIDPSPHGPDDDTNSTEPAGKIVATEL